MHPGLDPQHRPLVRARLHRRVERGHTKGYDLDTMDIVWSGQFAESGYTVDLTDWIKRDAAEINPADI